MRKTIPLMFCIILCSFSYAQKNNNFMIGTGLSIYPISIPSTGGYSATILSASRSKIYSLSGFLGNKNNKTWGADFSYSMLFGGYSRDRKNDSIRIFSNDTNFSYFPKTSYFIGVDIQYLKTSDIAPKEYGYLFYSMGFNMYLSKHFMMQMIWLSGPSFTSNDWGFALKFNLLYAFNKIKVY